MFIIQYLVQWRKLNAKANMKSESIRNDPCVQKFLNAISRNEARMRNAWKRQRINLNPKNRKDFEEIPQVYQNYISNSPFPLLSPKIRFQKSPKTLSIIGKRMDDDREKEGLQLNRSYPNIITHQFLRITSKGLILARLAHSRSNKQGMESVLTECKDSWMERR